MLYKRCFDLLSSVISWRNWTILVYCLWLSTTDADARICTSGLQFECKTTQGDGKTCVTGCDLTVAATLSPGNCTENCCKICYTDCVSCSYAKIITLCILNYKTNSSSPQHMFQKQSNFYKSLNKDLQTSIQASLQRRTILSTFEIDLLRVEWCSIIHDSLKVHFKVVTKNNQSLKQIVASMQNASRFGKLGRLNLTKNVFEVVEEDGYRKSKMVQDRKREGKIDVVELVITCIAALFVMLAIVWCLFYLCTTPAERARCNCCNACRRNRTAHASNSGNG